MAFWIVAGIIFVIWMISRAGKKRKEREEEKERQRKREFEARKLAEIQNNPQKQDKAVSSNAYSSNRTSTHAESKESKPIYAPINRVAGNKWKVQPSRVFKDNYLSYSRLSMFDQCPRQFELIYLCGHPDVSGEAAEKGSIVHKIAELATKSFVGRPTCEVAKNHTSQTLLSFYDQAVKDVKPRHSFTPDTLKPLLEKFLESCNVDSEQIILENEKTIDTHIWGYPVKCIIDRVDKGDDGIKLIDYKTGNKRYVNNFQLEIYGTAYHADTSSGDVHLEYQFLKDGTSKTWKATKSTFSKTAAALTSQAKEIENTTTFTRNKSPLCNYCGVAHLCYS